MFESLDEHMKEDAKAESTPKQRVLVVLGAVVVALAILGGLYFGVRLLE